MERREWIEKFELINDRKPTVSEMEEAEQNGEFETIMERQLQEQVAEAMRPTVKDRIFSFIWFMLKSTIGFFPILITSPLLLFTLIKNILLLIIPTTIGYGIFKLVLVGIPYFILLPFTPNPETTPFMQWLVPIFWGAEANVGITNSYFSHADWIIIAVLVLLTAASATFTFSEKER